MTSYITRRARLFCCAALTTIALTSMPAFAIEGGEGPATADLGIRLGMYHEGDRLPLQPQKDGGVATQGTKNYSALAGVRYVVTTKKLGNFSVEVGYAYRSEQLVHNYNFAEMKKRIGDYSSLYTEARWGTNGLLLVQNLGFSLGASIGGEKVDQGTMPVRFMEEAIGPEADCRIVNEAVVRSILFALLRGRAHRYRLKTQRRARGFRYLYSVSTTGKTVSYEKLRDTCARNTVTKNVQSEEGLESLCRYTFSIVAFMPEHVNDLLFSLGAGSGNCSAVVEAVEKLHCAVANLKKKKKSAGDGCAVRWDKIYAIFRNSFLSAVQASTPAELECFAYKVFSSKACDVVSEKLSNLTHILDQESIIDNAAEIAQLLGFLSNFDSRLSSHHKFSNTGESSREFTLAIDVDAVRDSVSDCNLWHHLVNLVTGARIHKRAAVNQNTLAAISMLFNMHLKISSCNMEAILFEDGSIAYTFARSFSFPLMKAVSCGNVGEGILASPAGRSLVDLMIKNHNARESCKFPLSYSEIAVVIKRLNTIMQDIRTRESIAYYINDAVCRNPDGNANVYSMAMGIAADIDTRLKFLQKFVESPDYKYLADFLMQSKFSDTHERFRKFLIAKRGRGRHWCDMLPFAVRHHRAYSKLQLPHWGIGLLVISIVIGCTARFTHCKRKRVAGGHAAAEEESGFVCHPKDAEGEAADVDNLDEHENSTKGIAGKNDYIIPVTIECGTSVGNNSIGA
ncbi:hypothetical protein GH714_042701 [Hevea brasiliensis]|uniref:Uncharacterized protein n=1 Tax=Hevea brasiliensis TaxID=3981 RepID=A0A6A6JZP1_HEVBR|nr:hypothetical protein GH714_042701 [Hevea brasiliensis]